MVANSFAVVTGATSGIGRALAELAAGDGYDLLLVGRSEESLAERAAALAVRFGVVVKTAAVDLALPQGPAAIVAATAGRPVDLLVNDAGFNVCGPFAETAPDALLGMVQIHMTSVVALTRALLPGMIARGRGRVLNLGSIASWNPCPNDAIYCAAKAFVLSFSDALAGEVAGSGVTVTTLCPGSTQTGFAARAGLEQSLLFAMVVMDAERVARIGYTAAKHGRRIVVPGFHNAVLVAFSGWVPRSLRDRLGRALLRPAPWRKNTPKEGQAA